MGREDRIRQLKATGLGNVPCHRSDANAAWLESSWRQQIWWPGELIGFAEHPDLATCEIDTLRYRILHVAARITRGARQIRLRIDSTWRWAAAIFQKLAPTPRRLPVNTRSTIQPTRKTLRPWKARPPSDTGRPVIPTRHNQTPQARQHRP